MVSTYHIHISEVLLILARGRGAAMCHVNPPPPPRTQNKTGYAGRSSLPRRLECGTHLLGTAPFHTALQTLRSRDCASETALPTRPSQSNRLRASAAFLLNKHRCTAPSRKRAAHRARSQRGAHPIAPRTTRQTGPLRRIALLSSGSTRHVGGAGHRAGPPRRSPSRSPCRSPSRSPSRPPSRPSSRPPTT